MKEARELLKKYFGYDDFRQGQQALIVSVLNGRDVLGIMPTGAGKSMCFQIPALMMEGITLVISPLISLMKDQVGALNQAGVHAAYLNSSLSMGQYLKALELAREGRYKIIYVAPERLETEGFLNFALSGNVRISFLAVDEAHCVSQWGQDFRPSYLKILDFLGKLPYRPVVGAYTATATEDVRDDILDILALRDPYVLSTGFDRSNLYFAVRKPADKYKELLRYLKAKEKESPAISGIIYCLTRKNVEDICYKLRSEGFSVTRYHAGLTDEERRENQDDFIYDRRQIMVATNAFGMGIDKPDVRFVVHYNMPKNMESYYQEAGRAGRDGESSECILYYEPMDVRTNRFFIENNKDNEELDDVTRELVKNRDLWRLQQMTFYCFTSECLRNYILKYFGQDSAGYCGNCLNCMTQFEEVDITGEAVSMIRCVKGNPMNYGITILIDILRGADNQRIRARKLDRNPEYGRLGHVTTLRLRQIFQELQFRGCLDLSGEEYPVVKVNRKAEEFLESGERLIIKLAREKSEKELRGSDGRAGKKGKKSKTGAASALSEKDARLFDALRRLRKEIAAREKVPPYIVFSDKTLALMSSVRPWNEDEMLTLSGVGEYKLEKYGEQFLEVIAKWQG
ncbi:MAG: DNA helicase RecQ [Dorea sp.]|nr:DNA helicase RecQ [Dorea sp.]